MPELARLLARLTRIVLTLALHGAKLAWRLAREPGSRRRLLGRGLAETCESLGATFVKAGQVLSARPDLVGPEVAAALRRLQDRVAPVDARRLPEVLERAFGRPVEEVFASFETEPVASASIAQVHRAYLPDGRCVAVKVRRPGVARQVREDLRWVRWLAAAVDRLDAFALVPLPELVEQVAGAVEEQLDLLAEAENNRRLRRNFAAVEQIRIPVLVEELCTESVLAMEFLDDLTKVDESHALCRADRERAALVGLRALYKMIFLDGFVHADLHPGNVFLRPWGELVLVDLGLVAKLDGADLKHFVDFFFGMVTNDGRECARVIRETASSFAPGFDPERFEAEMVRLIDTHASLKASEFEVTRFAFQLFDTQRRLGVRGATTFTMTILSLAVYEGIVKQLHPTLDFQREARAYLIAARYGAPRVTSTVTVTPVVPIPS